MNIKDVYHLFSGGMSGIIYDEADGGISGTVCLEVSASIWIMPGISMSSTSGPGPLGTHMGGGAVQVATDTGFGFGWVNVSTIPTISTSCSGLTTTPIYPLLACTLNLLGMPIDL